MRILRLFPVVSASLAIAVTLQTGMAGVTNSVLKSEPVLMVSPLALDLIQEIIPVGNQYQNSSTTLNPAWVTAARCSSAVIGRNSRPYRAKC